MKIDVSYNYFDTLLEKMGGDKIQWSLSDINLSEINDISIELERGLEIDISKLEIVGGVYSYEGEQLVVHIYDTFKIKDSVEEYPENNVRFHLRDCRTIQKMKEQNRFETRYIGTNNTSGIFKVTVYIDEFRSGSEEIKTELFVCKNCLSELDYKNYKRNKKQVWNTFALEEFFESYKTYFSEKPKYTCENIPKNEYPNDWKDISRKFRKNKNWRCNDCNLNLIDHHNLLHVHHINHGRFDNRSSNLQAVCIDCHSKKEDHDTMYVPENQRTLIIKLRREQNIRVN